MIRAGKTLLLTVVFDFVVVTNDDGKIEVRLQRFGGMSQQLIIDFIVSPLVGAGVLWVWIRFIWPIIDAMRTSAPRLPKRWQFYDGASGMSSGFAEITQYGSRIVVEATRTKSRDQEATSRSFKYVGRIVGRTVVLRFYQIGTRQTVSGALVLRLRSDMRRLDGKTSYFSDEKGEVVSNTIRFVAS